MYIEKIHPTSYLKAQCFSPKSIYKSKMSISPLLFNVMLESSQSSVASKGERQRQRERVHAHEREHEQTQAYGLKGRK